MNAEDKLKEVFSKVLGVDKREISLDSSLRNDLDVDSTEMVDLIVLAEKEFNVRIPEEIKDCFKSVRDIYNFITDNSVIAGR